MEAEFWHNAWEIGRLGFHQSSVHAGLRAFWSTLEVPADATVLVPLCGKSKDMIWLAEQGLNVLGVELSQIACEAFFSEHGWTPNVSHKGPFTVYQHGRIALWQGDIFELPDEVMVDAIYDRAATVALPQALRTRYATTLAAHSKAGAGMFMATLDYPQSERDGPPFSVDETEVLRLYGPHFDVTPLGTSNEAGTEAQRVAWGVSQLHNRVWRLRRRG